MFKFSVLIVFHFITSISSVWPAVQRYELPAGRLICELSLDIAKKEVGISDAKNPERVREYLKAAGVSYYNPFCMSGQYWSFVQAKKIIDYINQMFGFNIPDKIPHPRTALANYPFNYALKHGIKTEYKPKTGDYIIWFVAKTPNGHIERIISIAEAGWVNTIAFNTDNRQVKFKKRHLYNPIGIRLVRGLVGFKYE